MENNKPLMAMEIADKFIKDFGNCLTYSEHNVLCKELAKRITAAQVQQAAPVGDAARFLLDRLEEFSDENLSVEGCREWNGHILPAFTRLKTALAAQPQTREGKIQSSTDLSTIAAQPAPSVLREALQGLVDDLNKRAEDGVVAVGNGVWTRANAALAATAPADAGEGWQPIETAPTDNRDIWVAYDDGDVELCEDCTGMEWEPYDGVKNPYVGKPTHWQPYKKPAAPAHDGKGV